MDEAKLDRMSAALDIAFPTLEAEDRRLASEIYRALAEGNPAAPTTLAARSGLSLEDVERTLEEWNGVFRDNGGRVVAFWGLAIPEMAHGFEVGGSALHTWCAFDPFFIARILGTSARVTSKCPVSGKSVTLEVGPHGFAELDPPTAVMSFLEPEEEWDEKVIETFCHFVLFFATEEDGRKWTDENPGTYLVTLEEASELSRRFVEGRLAVSARR